MNTMQYIGLDLHKKTIWACAKRADGTLVERRKIPARHDELTRWAQRQPKPWMGIMEATLFTGWVYDTLQPHASELKVVHPAMAKAISAGKHSNDRVDSEQLADMGRCNWVPECYMMPAAERHLRRMLRYRTKLLSESVRFQNIMAGLLLSEGVEYRAPQLSSQRRASAFLDSLSELPESTRQLLRLSRSFVSLFNRTQRQLLQELRKHPRLQERVERLESIDGVGTIMALTWVLEVGDPQRLGSVAKARSYCGLTVADRRSADHVYSGPLSKQRNRHLQRVLVEVAQLAPRFNPALKALYDRERQRHSHNEVTILVARKLVAYLLAVDKSGRRFVALEEAKSNCPTV